VPKQRKKLVFYVDTECSLHSNAGCSYYSSERIKKQARESSKQAWGERCCPIVYVKTGKNRFTAFCPTKGGPFGEQLPTLHGPGISAVKVEIQLEGEESWPEIIEKAAKAACAIRG
jgi:hypothetical protein